MQVRSIVVVAVVLVLAMLASTYYVLHIRQPASSNLKNLNYSEVSSHLGKNYSLLDISNYTNLTSNLKSEGYKSISVAVYSYDYYNFSHDTFPETITSEVYAMSSTSAALAAKSSMLNSSNLGQNVTVYRYNFTTASGKISASIYNVYSIAVVNISNSTYGDVPVFQDSAIFSEGSTIGSVTSNGGPKMAHNSSLGLAEALLLKLAG
ncbi:MAG: hypothetical protein QXT94_03835 [Methanothrix sp.]